MQKIDELTMSYREELNTLLTEQIGTVKATWLYQRLLNEFGSRLVPLQDFAKYGCNMDESEAISKYRNGEFKREHLCVLEMSKGHLVVPLESIMLHILSEE